MTQHEQHMEVYAASILGVLQVAVSKMLHVADKFDLLDKEELKNTAEKLRAIQEAPNKITERLNKVIEDEKQETENKYLKLYQDSEDVCAKCVQVLTVMCANKVPDDADSNIIEAWSVIKCASGRVLVTVDYWGNDGDMYTYQFPVTWLDLPRKQIAELKVGCQLV